MKKILSFAVAVLASVSMFAQSEVGSISVLPKVGINLTNVTGDGDQDMKIGIVAGAEAAYQATDAIALSAGLLYSVQGCKQNDANYNLNYLNIPILANYYVAKGLAIKAGLQPAFLLSAKADGHDVKEHCKSFDFSIPVGISYEISKVVVEARYRYGLTKIEKGGDAKNVVLQLTVGYKF